MTDLTLGQEYANNIEGLKEQAIIVVSMVLMLFSLFFALFAVSKKSVNKAIFGAAAAMLSLTFFADATSVPCGCDFGEDPGGCSAACAYDWDDEFFTTKFAKGSWDGYTKGVDLPE